MLPKNTKPASLFSVNLNPGGFSVARPRQSAPPQAITIRSYAELDWLLQAFADGKFTLLYILSRPGRGKTELAKTIAKSDWLVRQGYNTAVRIYCDLFYYRNKPVILDDICGLDQKEPGQYLLTSLCQTTQTKTVSHNAASKILEDSGIPNQFLTTSKVLILANRTGSGAHWGAILDRAMLYYFDPTVPEMHNYAATWFPKTAQEVYGFIAENLDHFDPERFSLRAYHQGRQLWLAKGDWQGYLRSLWQTDLHFGFDAIMQDATLSNPQKMARAIKELGLPKTTAYVWAEKWRHEHDDAPKPAKQARGEEPPEVDIEAIEADLRGGSLGGAHDDESTQLAAEILPIDGPLPNGKLKAVVLD
jgi:hypothetical protein